MAADPVAQVRARPRRRRIQRAPLPSPFFFPGGFGGGGGGSGSGGGGGGGVVVLPATCFFLFFPEKCLPSVFWNSAKSLLSARRLTLGKTVFAIKTYAEWSALDTRQSSCIR